MTDPTRGLVAKRRLNTVGSNRGERERMPISEGLLLRMVKMANTRWRTGKARLMSALFVLLYHRCLRGGEAVLSDGNMENVLKGSHLKIINNNRSGHNLQITMTNFKHNKSRKPVHIWIKGRQQDCPVCILE